MATTTNYAWETPDDTDLVKDGAAAIRTLGSSIDTTTKALNPSTTLGDIEYRSSTANTNTRLGIGTTGQVLTVTGGAPVWATAGGGWNPNYELLNAGGTALTGATSVTVSGISGKNSLLIKVNSASSATAGSTIYLRLNSDSGTNYWYTGFLTVNGAVSGVEGTDSRIDIAKTGNVASDIISGTIIIDGTNAAGIKPISIASNAGGTDSYAYQTNGYYAGTSTISSISIHSAFGNLDAGTVFVYGA